MLIESIDQFSQFGIYWLSLLLTASWKALPIFVLVVGVVFAFRQQLTPAIHAVLWTVVVIRFLMPASLGSPLSIYGAIDEFYSSATDVVARRAKSNSWSDNNRLKGIQADIKRISAEPIQSLVTKKAVEWEKVLLVAVFMMLSLVTIAKLFRGAVAHIRFAIRLESYREVKDQEVIDMLIRECDSLHVGRRPKIREVSCITTPALFGILRPTICLPPNFLETVNPNELRWIFRHELAHIRRRDIPVLMIAYLAVALHWLNPLAWITLRRLQTAIEAAADRIAISNHSTIEAASYGHLLLRLSESRISLEEKSTLALMRFASGQHLKRRIELLISQNKTHGVISQIASMALLIFVAFVSLTDAQEFVAKSPMINLLNSPAAAASLESFGFDPWIARENDDLSFIKEYDIESILSLLPHEIVKNSDDKKSQLLKWIPMLPNVKSNIQIDGRMLIANLNSRQHEALAQTLGIWKNGEPRQIAIELRFLKTSLKLASSIDWNRRGIETMNVKGHRPAIATQITNLQLDSLFRAVIADPEGNITFAPKVTCFDGQSVKIDNRAHQSFMTGVKQNEDGQLQPVLSTLNQGLQCIVTPLTIGQDRLALSFEVNASNIGKLAYANLPIRVPNQPESHITVEVPTSEITTIGSTVQLSPGESIVVAIPQVFNLESGLDSDATTLVTLTPRVLPSEELVSINK